MFLPLTVCKLTQQRLRGSWGQSTRNNTSTRRSITTCAAQRGGLFFFLPRAPEAILINFPLKWEMTALHCSVVSILTGEKTKTTMTHRYTHKEAIISPACLHTWWYCKANVANSNSLNGKIQHDCPSSSH